MHLYEIKLEQLIFYILVNLMIRIATRENPCIILNIFRFCLSLSSFSRVCWRTRLCRDKKTGQETMLVAEYAFVVFTVVGIASQYPIATFILLWARFYVHNWTYLDVSSRIMFQYSRHLHFLSLDWFDWLVTKVEWTATTSSLCDEIIFHFVGQ